MRVFLILLAIAGCAAPPEPTPQISTRISGEAKPTQIQRETILALTQRYWLAIAESRHADAHAMFTPAYREANPLKKWQKTARLPAGALRQTNIHWLKNKDRIHGPELYAVVRWQTDQGAKGHVIWRETAGIGWEIDGTERL